METHMAGRKARPAFDSLWDAVVAGSPDDVRRLLDAGADADEREDSDDPTPLMYAAASGRLDVVELLVVAGADVDTAIEFDNIDLPGDNLPDDQPADSFLDELTSHNALDSLGWSAPGYAAVYGRRAVYDFLLPRASAAVRRQAEAVWAARQASEPRPRKPARSTASAAARKALLAEHPKLARWIVRCALCAKVGYNPAMPAETDRQGTAAKARELFPPLALEVQVCQRCRDKVEKAERAAGAVQKKRLAELPPHVKIEVVQPKPKKKRPGKGA
jgi:Ankyrin repeats (3 copies)